MSNVALNHAALQEAIRNMGTAHQDMQDGLKWMENNFTSLRETLTGETRVAWEDFQSELGTLKIKLNEQYAVAKTTLEQMHARQKQGDLDGGRTVKNAQGS